MPLIFTVPNYVDIAPKSSPSIDPAVKKWSKIVLHFSSKNIDIEIKFIVVIVFLNTEAVVLFTGKVILAKQGIIGHYKSERLKFI